MSEALLQEFVDHYSSSDFDKIKFDWNQKYGDEFQDPNYKFRMKVCEFLLPQIGKVKLELIRDLYLENAKTSEATFGIYLNFNLFAQELLQRGGTRYLMDYIKGMTYSMDAGIMSGNITVTKDRAKELLDYFDEKRKNTTGKEELLLLNDFVRRRLEYHANK